MLVQKGLIQRILQHFLSCAESGCRQMERIVVVLNGFEHQLEHLAEGGPEDVPEREIKRFLRLNLPIHDPPGFAFWQT